LGIGLDIVSQGSEPSLLRIITAAPPEVLLKEGIPSVR
jgi:hypothetical protein